MPNTYIVAVVWDPVNEPDELSHIRIQADSFHLETAEGMRSAVFQSGDKTVLCVPEANYRGHTEEK